MSRPMAFVVSGVLAAWVVFAAQIQKTIKDDDVRPTTTLQVAEASTKGRNVTVKYTKRTIGPPDPRDWRPPEGETWSQIRLDVRTFMVELDQRGTRRFKHSVSLPALVILPAIMALTLFARAAVGAPLRFGVGQD